MTPLRRGPRTWPPNDWTRDLLIIAVAVLWTDPTWLAVPAGFTVIIALDVLTWWRSGRGWYDMGNGTIAKVDVWGHDARNARRRVLHQIERQTVERTRPDDDLL